MPNVDDAHFIVIEVANVNFTSYAMASWLACEMLTSTTLIAMFKQSNRYCRAMARSRSSQRPYHHGDLRRVIVRAALEILRETQNLEFSLRELARRAGVSHNAPYKHFADKRELLAAVSAAGFEMLTQRMAQATASLDKPREQLFAMLRAYIDHGVENPALYGLMFGGYLGGPDRSRPSIELVEAEKTKALLSGVIVAGGLGRAIPEVSRNERRIAGAILACWSLVHGLTLLLADGLVGPKAKSGALGARLVQGMLDGLAAELPSLPPGTWVGPKAVTQ
jgi:AcrR family transcriptional regulator